MCIGSLSGFSQSNQYLDFDGQNDVAIVENASNLFTGTTTLSMTAWIWTDELGIGKGSLGFRSGSSNDFEFYFIQLDGGALECRIKMGSDGSLYEYVAPAGSVAANEWQHFALVYNGLALTLYINGFQFGSSVATGAWDSNNVDFTMGQSPISCCNFYHDGRMDEVSVWKKALSISEIEDMIDNEIDPDSEDLELYFKFNQGVPDEDNTSITELISEVGAPDRNASLMNFDLTGVGSNFGGELDLTYQTLTFPQIPNKLTTDVPFEIAAASTAELPVEFEIISGPASIDGTTITLNGTPGEVIVTASQPGNADFDPADPISNSFMVLDATTFVPSIEARSPIAGDVHVPELGPIQLAAISTIDFPELFNVAELKFVIGTDEVIAQDWGNGHFTGWWEPADYGTYEMTIISKNNYGANAMQSISFDVLETASDIQTTAFDDIWVYSGDPTETREAELPCYLGAFDQIIATLDVTCPTGGCDPWDRVVNIEAKGHNGEWIEIIRYITSYGVACDHTVDLTDFASILQGKISFRVTGVTFGNGFDYELNLAYQAGTPAYKYSAVQLFWSDTYEFGDLADLQPVQGANFTFQENVEDAKIKLVSTGHGWSGNDPWYDNNTGNAAEFYDGTHHIWVNGEETFAQHNWNACFPNPDGCQPQNGTYQYDRAGWCPGTIAPWFDFSLSDFMDGDAVALDYVFDETYIDYCHPNNPDCEEGVTCHGCDDGFNPHLIVSSNFISFSNMPIGFTEVMDTMVVDTMVTDTMVTDTMTALNQLNEINEFSLSPNPSRGIVRMISREPAREMQIFIYNAAGDVIESKKTKNVLNRDYFFFDMRAQADGIYFVEVITEEGKTTKKLILQK